ncbi:FAD-dependent oxidoreductase, partial [Cellulomonas citrea]
MPFEEPTLAPRGNIMRRNIAVIGAGISGMGAAHKLASNHAVTLFEAGKRIGGHAR